MVTRTPRILLALSSVISGLGSAMHALAFPKAMAAIDGSNMLHFYGGSSKALWLADSATLFILAVIFGLIAARPSVASRPLVMVVALIPAATAILIYTFLGGFIAGHILVAIAILALLAGTQFPGSVAAS